MRNHCTFAYIINLQSMSLYKKFALPVSIILLFTLVTLGQERYDTLQQFISHQESSCDDTLHELTIYLIPSLVKIDWDSPRSLYLSYIRNMTRSIFNNHNYLIGHAFVELRSPRIPGRFLAGMRSASKQEQMHYVLRENYGMAILGTALQGRLETNGELTNNIELYARRGNLAFIRVYINDEAVERVLDFFHVYLSVFGNKEHNLPSYGGAFWPRYESEGAGCSAFAVSFLDIAGVMRQYFDEWKIQVGIPMELIGGPYNNYHKVRIRDIKNHKSWSDENGEMHVTYEPYEVYDPSLIFEWIHDTWNTNRDSNNTDIIPVVENDVFGLIFDARNTPAPNNEPLFRERKKRSVFIDHYRQEFFANPEDN